MFIESLRIGCSFPACHGGSAKYQTYLIFHLLHESVSRPCLRSPGNRPIVDI